MTMNEWVQLACAVGDLVVQGIVWMAVLIWKFVWLSVAHVVFWMGMWWVAYGRRY